MGIGILGQQGIQDGIGNLIGHLVGMPLGDGFRREEIGSFGLHDPS